MITLSKRLEAIAALITPGNIVADVGTDHGYIPIYLVQQNISPSAIAMDLRPGPLARAEEHIRRCGLADRINTRLSDGTRALAAGEADTIVVAGMGGELVIHILTEGEAVCRSARELILQPQSEIAGVRRYLREHAYRITAENMILEDGKYYPMMRVVPECGEESFDCGKRYLQQSREEDTCRMELCDLYGKFLLEARHPVLQQYLAYQETILAGILEGLFRQPDSETIRTRIREVEQKMEWNHAAQKMM